MELRQCNMVSSFVRTLTICSYPRPILRPTVSEQTFRSLERSFVEIHSAILWLVHSMKGRLKTNHPATHAITKAMQLGKFEEEFASSKRELIYLKKRLFEDRRNRSENYHNHQAESLSRLTILATCFLPLSVSATVLSMQTRFFDLGFLLYDLAGVTFLLGLIAWTGLLCLKAMMAFRKRKYNSKELNPRTAYTMVTYFTVVFMTGLFLFGMTRDDKSGSKFLELQAAACVLFLLLVLGVRYCI